MNFGVVSLFPEIFESHFTGLVGQAHKKKLFELHLQNPRDFASGVHQAVDDELYGGGDGMLLKPEPIYESIQNLKSNENLAQADVVYLSPQGQLWNQDLAHEWAQACRPKIFICGRYAGLDERVVQDCDQEISIGNYVLNGGELAALVVIESVVRLLKGALGNQDSALQDSLSTEPLLEAPQYTRPRQWKGQAVPETLLSGDHKKIQQWKVYMSLLQTAYKRKDLLNPEACQNLKALLASKDPVAKICMNDFGLERLEDIKAFLSHKSTNKESL